MLFKLFDSLRAKENQKKKYAVIFASLFLGLIAGYYVWAHFKIDNPALPPFTEADQELVGEWKLECPGPPIQKDFGYTLLPDHKCIKRWYVPDSNTIRFENEDFLWWREGDHFTIRSLRGATKDILSIGSWRLETPLRHDTIYHITPDGPGRYKFEESISIQDICETPRPTGSGNLSRVERKSDQN